MTAPDAKGSVPGDNSKTASAQRLKQFIQRIEKLEDEKKNIGADVREVYSELKGAGFDPKIARQVIKLRRMDKADRDEQEALLDAYLDAVGYA